MLKILIDNEEVVADKNLQIKKEMLNPSSVILNNCYPKAWLNDYSNFTNKFYFPKNYSKCLIYEANDVSNFKIYGYCKQDGDPSPDHPVPIETFTGNQEITLKGKTYPLSLGDLELCGIGDHKDYIYYKDEKWWKHKEIGLFKYGGESISIVTSKTNYIYYNIIKTLKTVPSSQIPQALSNLFVANSGNYLFSTDDNSGFTFSKITGNFRFNIQKEKCPDISKTISWLKDNQLEVYYLLDTPTEEEITDPTLLSQLELIRQRLIFAGAVLNTGNISLNPRCPHYCNLQVIDFKTLLSIGDTLDFVILNKTIEEAINMVVDAIKDYGFVVGDIKTLYNQDLIGNYSTQEKTPYDVFQYLAQISQSQWSTRMINENQIAIDFYDPTLMPTAPNILNTKEYFKENNIDDISYSYSSSDYRNKQIMLSDQVYGSIDYTETIVANGYQTTFNTLSNIGVMKSIKVNDESKTFISKTQSELGFSADFIYEIGKTTIEASKTWTAGSVLTIVYTPLVQGREIASNTDEINRVTNNIGRRGVISRYENRNDATSSYELQRIGESYIRYKGYPTITLKIKTHNKDLFDIGQITTYEAPLSELSTTYMVKSKSITQIYAKDLLITNYEYELVNNFNSEKALNYFDNQRAKATGNLKEGEFITRNVDIENTATIRFFDLDIKEGTALNNNLLDSVLDSVFLL